MNDKIKKNEKTINFILKWFLIAIVLFIIIQTAGGIVIKAATEPSNRESYEKFQDDYIGHWYNGTFFINMMVSENFENKDTYIQYKKEFTENKIIKVTNIISNITGIFAYAFLILAFIRNRKKKLLEGITPILVLISGVFYLITNILIQTRFYIDSILYQKYAIGFLKTCKYYFQAYYILTIPSLLIALGLILKYIQNKKDKKNTSIIEKIIKIYAGIFLTVGLILTSYRLGTRLYELIMILKGQQLNIRLPFYYYIFDLPYEFAKTSSAYTKIVVLRFIKDLPVFIASTITIILFSKILISNSNNKISIKENNKRYKIIFISLIISSVIFNLLGLLEVNIFNNNFLQQYKEATYTIGIRSFCEPIYYGLYIYLFKHFSYKADIISKEKKNK